MTNEYRILGVAVAGSLFGVVPAQIQTVSIVDPADPPIDMQDRPVICCDLGPLLGGAIHTQVGARHALIVALRRRSVALLIDGVDSLPIEDHSEIQMLAPMLTQRLARPWFLGAVVYQDAPVLLLDLRRIATDVMIGAV